MTLRIVLAADSVQHSNNQELLSTLLKNLGSVAKSLEPKELCKLLEAYQSLQNGSNAGTSGTANAAEEAAGPSNSKLPSVNGSHRGQASSSAGPVQSKATMVVAPGMMCNHCQTFRNSLLIKNSSLLFVPCLHRARVMQV